MALFIAISIVFCLLGAWQAVLRLRSEKALKALQERLHSRDHKIHTILNNAPIVFTAIDAKGIIRISEGKGLEKLGRKSNQSVGVSIFEMHNQNPVILDAVSRALAGEHVAVGFSLMGITYELFIGPEKNAAGGILGASMLSVDITDRKKAEDEKAQLIIRERTAIETSKLKSEFLATMSHEIRTPLNGVIGMTSLILDTTLSPEQKEYAEAIKQSGSWLLMIINDILDFSKIEADKIDFEELNFDLPTLLHHIVKGLQFSASAKEIALVLELESGIPSWVKGDPGRFRQIINNLVGNAIKFTEIGQVVLRVKAEALPSNDSRFQLRLEVEDTGVGISKEGLAKIFAPFSQAESSMSRRFGGTGLGLSISKKLAEKMGGTIGVVSEEGKGSMFWFVLPFAAGETTIHRDFTLLTPLNSSLDVKANSTKILVAEDNLVNQVITTRMLKKMGYDSEVVIDGAQAIEALKNSVYDLVLMDCQMPVLDGLEATQKFRAADFSQNRGIPILAMTANAMKGDKEKCLAAGMNDYVSKPVSFEELRTVVNRWLEVKRKRA